MKLTAFVPAKYGNLMKNDVIRNREFWLWFRENKDWVEVAAHGLSHTLPPEFTKFRHYQEVLVKKMSVKLKRYFPKNAGFKAPYHKINTVTLEVLMRAGYSYVASWNTILWMRKLVPNPPSYVLENSHTSLIEAKHGSSAYQDNINLIRRVLDKKLKRWERRGVTYLKIGEYVEMFGL